MTFWVRLRFKHTGYEMTYEEQTAFARALLIIVTTNYADVVDQGGR